jgi:hypothetical protein
MGMNEAYRVADELLKDRLRDRAPGALADISELTREDVVVTTGCYDFIQNVFDQSGIEHATVDPRHIDRVELNSDQVVFVNCPGDFSRKGVHRLRQFVHDGGFLFTTDWALKNVVEPAFPGFIEYNGNQTSDDVVGVEISATDDPFLASIIGPDDEPQWWLEGSSYPIRVLRQDVVDVLITSPELGRKYGEPAVLVAFEFGAGKVYHMISHFYLQRTETRTARQQGSTYDYLSEKGVAASEFARYSTLGADDASLGEVESAMSSRGIMGSVLHAKRQRTKNRGGG